MFTPVLITPPAVTPVSLVEAKAHLRVDYSDEDGLISALIAAAVSHLDGYTGTLGRAMIDQTWYQEYDGFSDKMRLEVGPVLNLSAISSFFYLDGLGILQPLANTQYILLNDELGDYLSHANTTTWPATYPMRSGYPVSIEYTAGFGATADAVPAAIRAAILLMIGHWYVNREAVAAGPMSEVPMAVKALIEPWRRVQR